jgi:aminopeptidase N
MRSWSGRPVDLGARRAPWSRVAPFATLAVVIAGALAQPCDARPVLFPPTPTGPAEWRDERDVSPYLAAWKAAAMSRARAMKVAGTANQAAWDARTYSLDLAFDPTAMTVSGSVRMTATVRTAPITTLDLDLLSNMTVDGVSVDGVARTFTRPGDLLTISLGRPYLPLESVLVVVQYHGAPLQTGPFGAALGFTTKYGRPHIWSISEPYGARSWWPCKDAPEDKADSVDVRFTVPSGMTTVSNGTRVSSSDDGMVSVARWHERHPIATYLISIASYPYTATLDTYQAAGGVSMPITFYNFPEDLAQATPSQTKVKGMIAAYAARMGPYPFLDEKYGHAETPFGGGMENQTCTSLGVYNESVVAHELGHQWWGDLVTCRNFHHIWLNESFATYMESLWAEANGGMDAYRADLMFKTWFDNGTVYVPDTSNVSRIFHYGLSYEKGSWVLHMLRHVMSDTLFFQALRKYRTDFAYGTAVTEDFEGVCQAVSGRDLHRFFQEWIYGEYYPVYRYGWSATAGVAGWDVTFTLEQTQAWQIFTMPVDVRISTTSGDRTFVVQDSLASQTFTLHVDAQPTFLLVDPDEWILRQFDQPVANQRFDRPVLLVNGVDWSVGNPITSAYADRAFTGAYPVDFWDVYERPVGGYPSPLPAPLGHGALTGDVLGRYRSVVWVGATPLQGLFQWDEGLLMSYLRAGGNLLLLSESGQYLADSLGAYAGLTLVPEEPHVVDCVAARPAMGDLTFPAGQQWCALFDTVRTHPDSELLLEARNGYTPPRAIAAIREPVGGAGGRPYGGRFAFLSGFPYVWDHAPLSVDATTILANYFHEPVSGLGVGHPPSFETLQLSNPWPNPFHTGLSVRLSLGSAASVDARVMDAAGRLVRVLVAASLAPGRHVLVWDGQDATGRPQPAGVYWLSVRVGSQETVRKLVRLP